MKKDYVIQLQEYAFPQTKMITQSYLDNYWLTEYDFLNKWKKRQEIVFNPLFKGFPDLIFNEGFDCIVLKGGLIFNKESFNQLIECAKIMGDKEFSIIEHIPPNANVDLQLKFKYSIDIKWHELNKTANGDILAEGICYELFQRPVRNYFVFGDSCNWGKYVYNDYDYPIDIILFKSEYSSVFENGFRQSKQEKQEVKEWVPKNYHEFLI